VLEGICKQTHSFKAECLTIADEYYDKIYETLTKDLNPEGACFLIGICPKGLQSAAVVVPSMPMLPAKTAQQVSERKVLGANEPQFSAQQIQSFQLPIDKLMFGGQIMEFQRKNGDTQFCALCEYFLHFVQESLAAPKNEEDIKNVVAHTCERLPKSIVGECQGFVSQYGDAVIALLIQDIDPAIMCPRLNVCARTYSNEECPLCLFIYQQVEAVIENNRTKENIKNKLNTLCDRLPSSLKTECSEFIAENAEALIDNLIKRYSPQVACVKIHMCTPKQEMLIGALGSKRTSMAIETNEIEDNTIDGVEANVEISTPECLLCEQLIKEVEKKASNDKSRAHIEQVLEHACESLPKANLRQSCIAAVKKNSDYIIEAIIKNVTPKEICVVLAFCAPIPRPPGNDPQCVLCELVMEHFEKELANKSTVEEIEQTFLHICKKLPKTVTKNCESFVKQYADLVITLATKVSPKEICTEINLCRPPKFGAILETKADVLECAVCHAAAEALSDIMKTDNSTERVYMAEKTCNVLPAKYVQRCSKFMGIYFESLHNLVERNEDLAKICEQVGMCFKNEASVTLGDNEMAQPEVNVKKQKLVGSSKCTYGPSYWCHNADNMNECNAHVFCMKKYKAYKVILT
jgi:saposin